MLDKVIAIGKRGGKDYRVRNKLTELVEDEGWLASLLWQAFEAGHSWVVRNPLLADYAVNLKAPLSSRRLLACLEHPGLTWLGRSYVDHKRPDERRIFWSDALPRLLDLRFKRHPLGSVDIG